MAEDVTLDDLPAIDFAHLITIDVGVCYRCSNLVMWTEEHREAHERWHAAIEDLSVTVQVEDGRLLTLDHGTVKLGGAGASAQPEHMERQVEQYADRARDAEAHNLRLKGELVRQSDLVEELRKQVESLSQASQSQRRDLRAALDVGPEATWSMMIRMVSYAVNAVDARERDLVEALKLNQNTGWQAALDVVRAWVRVALLDPQPEPDVPPFGLREQLFEALQVQDTGQDLVALVRELRTEHGKLELRTWTTDQVNARVDERRAGIIALLELAARGRRKYATGSAGRELELLQDEANTFENAAKLVKDPTIIRSFIPTSMLPEVGKLADDTRPAASMPGVPLGAATISTGDDGSYSVAAQPVPGIDRPLSERELAEIYQASGWGDAEQAAEWASGEQPPADGTEPITDEQLSDLLLLVGINPSAAQLSAWTDEQREQAAQWAGLVHLSASDNNVDVPDCPGFLVPDRFPGVVNARSLKDTEDVWMCSRCKQRTGMMGHPNGCPEPAVEQAVGVPERSAFLDEQPSEVCPSLYLAPDGQLRPCNLAIELHLKPSSGPADHWHAYLIDSPDGDAVQWRWQGRDAVLVPWPLDQEPPPGINLLTDGATNRRPYLHRVDGNTWRWSDSTAPPDRTGLPWATAVLNADGDLTVVRRT